RYRSSSHWRTSLCCRSSLHSLTSSYRRTPLARLNPRDKPSVAIPVSPPLPRRDHDSSRYVERDESCPPIFPHFPNFAETARRQICTIPQGGLRLYEPRAAVLGSPAGRRSTQASLGLNRTALTVLFRWLGYRDSRGARGGPDSVGSRVVPCTSLGPSAAA